MAALINALDNYTPNQIGENGHVEYGWSNSIQERILQFSFQVTRTTESGIHILSEILNNLLKNLKHMINTGCPSEIAIAKGHLSILYKMIGNTRDIIDGKGECLLSYMMVHTWYQFYPELAKFALRCFVTLDNKEIHQYGSWKDLKYLCKYCKEQDKTEDSPLIKYAIQLINQQITIDYANLVSGYDDFSLASKWTPREKSSFGWMYSALATDYFSYIMDTAETVKQKTRALLKCKTDYRKIISAINQRIDTTQIKQCAQTWQKIDFNKVSSVTLSKQKKAFLNIKKDGSVRYSNNFDRETCAVNFNNHIQKAVNGNGEIKGKRVGMNDFVKQAMDLLKKGGTPAEKDLLNLQWRDNSSENSALGKMIAMVDVSASMEGEPMEVAIALGIRIAEKSMFGKRVMTFSDSPSWVNLDSYNDFISQVKVVKNARWGMNTDFNAALDMILDSIVKNKISPEDVQDMVLVILSDMQMDAADNCNKQVLYDIMKTKYENAGLRVHGIPYKPPHILFWNLRSTTGFPNIFNQPNTSMMSGFSPSLLNLFCEEGFDALQSCTPWSFLVKSLQNIRYKIMEDKFNDMV
jgi:Mg-chelatase subunit ChlD